MFENNSCPIQSQIKDSNVAIKELEQRIEDMEINLKSPNLPTDKKNLIESELKEIKKLVYTNKDLLSKLHKENSKTYAVAACLVFICFLVYGLYVLVNGP